MAASFQASNNSGPQISSGFTGYAQPAAPAPAANPAVAPQVPPSPKDAADLAASGGRTSPISRVDPSTILSSPSSTSTTPVTFADFEAGKALTNDEYDKIASQFGGELQSQIDAINAQYDASVNGQQKNNAAADARVKVLNANTGNIDSGTGSTAINNQSAKDQAAIDQINAQRTAKLSSVIGQIDQLKTNAINLAEQKKTTDYNTYQTLVQKHQTDAENTVKAYIQNGGSLDKLKTSEPDSYNALAQAMGGEQQLKTYAMANAPTSTYTSDKPTEVNGKWYLFQKGKDANGNVTITPQEVPGVGADSSVSHVLRVPGEGLYVFKKDGTYQVLGSGGTSGNSTSNKKTDVINNFSKAFVPGATLSDGTPVIDENGYITPAAWKSAITDAPNYGLTRADFIKTFGSKLYTENGSVPSSYGLTPAEVKLITGSTKTSSSSTVTNPFSTTQ